MTQTELSHMAGTVDDSMIDIVPSISINTNTNVLVLVLVVFNVGLLLVQFALLPTFVCNRLTALWRFINFVLL